MAILRDATPGKFYLNSMVSALLRENADLVIEAIWRVARAERREGESALPPLGRILRELADIESERHPLAHLHDLVRKLAAAFDKPVTVDLLRAFDDAAGHRTDEDLDKGYLDILKFGESSRMPTPREFLRSCGVPKIYRNGTKPQD